MRHVILEPDSEKQFNVRGIAGRIWAGVICHVIAFFGDALDMYAGNLLNSMIRISLIRYAAFCPKKMEEKNSSYHPKILGAIPP